MSNTFYVLCGIFFLINVSLAFIPYWTRKTENFGVSIPESLYHRPDFKAMRKKYTISLIVINTVLFSIVIFSSFHLEEKTLTVFLTIAILLYVLLTFFLYLPFHFQMKNIKVKENWNDHFKQTIVVDPKFREGKITYSNGWFFIPSLITVFTIVFTFLVYDNIPNEVPIHTSITGKITYAEKSIGNVLLLPVSQLFLIGSLLIVNYVIKHSKQQISSTNPEVSKLQNIIFRRRWSLYTIISSILITLLFSFLQLTMIYPTLMPYQDVVIISTIVITLLGTILISITTGQGGSRVKITSEDDRAHIDRDDDRYWKLGQFYFNKNDPAIFVEKRFGIGWTNNWAHPVSWIIILAILTVAIGLPIILTKF